MEFRVNISDLKKVGISLTQYLFIWGIYNGVKVKYLDIKEEAIEALLRDGWMGKIKGTEFDYGLTEKGIELFEPSGGIFEKFLALFPTRVSNQAGVTRVLSPVDPNSISGKKLKRKWYSITKNKQEIEEHILKCLEKEVELRRKDGSLYWMRNVEAWLNKATWEDYEYLLETKKEESITSPNVIKL